MRATSTRSSAGEYVVRLAPSGRIITTSRQITHDEPGPDGVVNAADLLFGCPRALMRHDQACQVGRPDHGPAPSSG